MMSKDDAEMKKKALRTQVHPVIFGDVCSKALDLQAKIETRLAQLEDLRARVNGIDDATLEEHDKRRKQHLLDFITRYIKYYERFKQQWEMLGLTGVTVQQLSESYDRIMQALDAAIAGTTLKPTAKGEAGNARDKLKDVVRSIEEHGDIITKLDQGVKAADDKFTGEKGILRAVQKFEQDISMPQEPKERLVLEKILQLYQTFTDYWRFMQSLNTVREFRRHQVRVYEFVGFLNGTMIAVGRDLVGISAPRFDPIKGDMQLAGDLWRQSQLALQNVPRGMDETEYRFNQLKGACAGVYPNLRAAAEKASLMMGQGPNP